MTSWWLIATLLALLGALFAPAWAVAVTRLRRSELLARHWSLDTVASVEGLGLDRLMDLASGALTCWNWYRQMEWLE